MRQINSFTNFKLLKVKLVNVQSEFRTQDLGNLVKSKFLKCVVTDVNTTISLSSVCRLQSIDWIFGTFVHILKNEEKIAFASVILSTIVEGKNTYFYFPVFVYLVCSITNH